MATEKQYAYFIRKMAADHIPPDHHEDFYQRVLDGMAEVPDEDFTHDAFIRIIAAALADLGSLDLLIKSTVRH